MYTVPNAKRGGDKKIVYIVRGSAADGSSTMIGPFSDKSDAMAALNEEAAERSDWKFVLEINE